MSAASAADMSFWEIVHADGARAVRRGEEHGMRGKLMRGTLLVAALLTIGIATGGCGSSSDATTGDTTAASTAPAAAAIAVGDSVAATWTDGDLYLATVTALDGDTITVKYADDGTSASLPAAEVRPIPQTTFAVGDRVLAVWSQGRFYAGKVTEANGTSYVVAWDDGSTPSAVRAGQIIAP
jgi:hypothetical protein